MANLTNTYDLQEIDMATGYRFLFESEGPRSILKAVRYSYVQVFEDRKVYNLGFGDYDLEKDRIVDQATSNNGDAYKVFQTVLSTVPHFFKHNPEAMLLVQGSDGRSDFVEKCKEACLKRCTEACKKFNQRITIYRNYVEKNFDSLSLAYWFLGGITSADGNITIERYLLGNKYDAILLFRK
ncbi:DUF6934 family protein [Dyadobacter sp. CY323]|uniref:DUF6934 family protein n=1 Tax=Dyadobacter sp. CY323 TaxID=2907302 RepID=UPI001F2892A0|nr:hypothetical protein [Dyadobacter sp. CY323]MCE6990792.1 hypothetical protein [Dyadobacter sp. CY323]